MAKKASSKDVAKNFAMCSGCLQQHNTKRSFGEPPFSVAQACAAERLQTQRDELDSSKSLGGGGANSNLCGKEAYT